MDDDVQLDDTGDVAVDDTGDANVVDGMQALAQDLRHRLMTVKGSLPADPDYGASLPLFLHQASHPAGRRAIRNACLIELAKEERILPQRTEVTVTAVDKDTVRVVVRFVRKVDLEPGQVEVTT